VLPFAGLFSKHEAPGRHVTDAPSHASILRATFPAASATARSRYGSATRRAPGQLSRQRLASQGLLPAKAMIRRDQATFTRTLTIPKPRLGIGICVIQTRRPLSRLHKLPGDSMPFEQSHI
jgi:hypothetical protein